MMVGKENEPRIIPDVAFDLTTSIDLPLGPFREDQDFRQSGVLEPFAAPLRAHPLERLKDADRAGYMRSGLLDKFHCLRKRRVRHDEVACGRIAHSEIIADRGLATINQRNPFLFADVIDEVRAGISAPHYLADHATIACRRIAPSALKPLRSIIEQ